ncbi:MAG: DUF1634 domain-containing protein [Acidimicrobiia bacterium]
MSEKQLSGRHVEEKVVALILRVGLVVAAALMAVGLIIKLVEGDLVAHALTLSSLLHPVDGGDEVMAWGVLLLAATPAATVVSLGVIWAIRREWRSSLTAVVVTAILVAGALAGR